MEDCIFCKIIKKEIPSKIVYEDDDVLAFEDINPVAPVHILVIPKKHIDSVMQIDEIDEQLVGKMYSAIKKIANQLNLSQNGFRVITNCGEDAGQIIHHIHFHVLGGKHLGPKLVN